MFLDKFRINSGSSRAKAPPLAARPKLAGWGGSFLMVCRNNAGRLGAGCISVCLDSETRWLGHYGGFYVLGWPCTREKERDMRARSNAWCVAGECGRCAHCNTQYSNTQCKAHCNTHCSTNCIITTHILQHVSPENTAELSLTYASHVTPLQHVNTSQMTHTSLMHEQPTPPRTDKIVWNTTHSWLVRVRQDSFVIHSCETWLIPDSFACDMTHSSLWFGRGRQDSFVTRSGESFVTVTWQSYAIWLTIVDVVLQNLNPRWNLKLITPGQH